MSFGVEIFSMIAGWAIVAGAMLWGVLRIGRRHQPPVHMPDQEPQSILALSPSECALDS